MGRTSVALMAAGSVLFAGCLEAGKPQAENLIPLIGEVIACSAISFAALDRIAVCVGPGGFSGIRAGVAAARAIGLAANIPVVGATSFQIMAAAFERDHEAPGPYGLAAPAGAGAVFCQIFRPGRSPLTDAVAMPQAEAGAFFEGRVETIAGPAASALREQGYLSLPISAPNLVPDAATLAALGASLDPERDLPIPLYVRPADARPQTAHLIPRKPNDP